MASINVTSENFPTRILRLPEVLQLVGLSKSTVYALIKDGLFPAPVQLSGTRAVGWVLKTVLQWIESRR